VLPYGVGATSWIDEDLSLRMMRNVTDLAVYMDDPATIYAGLVAGAAMTAVL